MTGAGLAAANLVACAPEEVVQAPGNPDTGTATSTADPSTSTTPNTQAQAATGDSSIFVVRGTDGTDDGIRRLIALMENNGEPFYKTAASPQGLIATNDVIIIKINCQWNQRGGTNTDLLEKLITALAAHPEGFVGEVIVADNGQSQYGSNGNGGSLDWDETNSLDKQRSALDVVNELKGQLNISGVLWDEFTMQKVGEFSAGDIANGFVVEDAARSTGIVVTYPKFTTEYGTGVSFKEGIWDERAKEYDRSRLKLINTPVLKVHGGYQVTGAVKAYMGTTASRLTNQASHNSVGAGGMGTQLANTFMPTLNIMDMIWVGVSRGPGTRYDDAVAGNMIASSTDPVALDWWCTNNVLIPLVEEAGRDIGRLNPDATDSGTFGRWLGLSASELINAGFKANRGDAVKVYE